MYEQAAQEHQVEIDIHAVALALSSDHIPDADVLLIGPQIRCMKNKIMAVAAEKPVADIEMRTYGTMDGETVFAQIMEMVK